MNAHERHAKINPAKGTFREIARGLVHYPVLRNETVDHFGGLQKLREGLKKGQGAVVIYTHFSEVDPVWVMNDITEEIGLRNTPVLQPIAIDRTYGGAILKLGKAVGVDIMPIVTPDAKERAAEKENVKQGEGLSEYFNKMEDALKNGGIVTTPYIATRETHLRVSEPGVTTKLVYEMKKRGVDFNIHFVVPELPGVEDYKTKRKFNLFKKYKIHHGETYTLQEFFALAAGEEIPGEKPKRREIRALSQVEKAAHGELAKIAPEGYLPRKEATTPVFESHEKAREYVINTVFERINIMHPATLTREDVEKIVDTLINKRAQALEEDELIHYLNEATNEVHTLAKLRFRNVRSK